MEELELQSSPQPICTGYLPECFIQGGGPASASPRGPCSPRRSSAEAAASVVGETMVILGLWKKGILKPSPPDPTQAGLQPWVPHLRADLDHVIALAFCLLSFAARTKA